MRLLSGPLSAALRKWHMGLPAAGAAVTSPVFPQPVLCVWTGRPRRIRHEYQNRTSDFSAA